MAQLSLEEISRRLESDSSKDRMIALANLRNVPAAEAAPLVRKVIDDKNLQIRSMAVFALGLKPDEQAFETLVNLMESDAGYGIRADAAGALGYLGGERAFGPLVRA